ncbi:hypothetical protein M885DRAFT_624997 [Pelagophyceae sp. CCMP2097]|nr:hypothetical protein M885DRAFT_624997 [Pelagophyceae sp. CCMP2097]
MESECVLDRASPGLAWGIDVGQMPGETALLVRGVTAGGPADGLLRSRDAILRIDGVDVADQHSAADFDAALTMFDNGALRISIVVRREGPAPPGSPTPQRGPAYSPVAAETPPRLSGARAAAPTTPWSRFTQRVRAMSLMPVAHREDERFFHVAPRLVAVRGGAAFERLCAVDGGSLRDAICADVALRRGLFEPDALKLVAFNFGDAATPRSLVDSLGGTVIEVGWRVAQGAHTPCLAHLVRVGAAAGAVLARVASAVVVLLDAGGGHARVGLGVAAALRVGARLEPALRAASDSAPEAYDLWLAAAALEERLSLALLPPSFARCLSTLDSAVACGLAPNSASALFVAGARLHYDATALDFDVACRCGGLQLDVGDERHTTRLSLVEDDSDDLDTRQLRCDAAAGAAVEVRGDFVVTLRAGGGDARVGMRSPAGPAAVKIARFAGHAAFFGGGELVVPRAALDVFPDWRAVVPARFELRLRLEARPTRAEPAVLVPAGARDLAAYGLALLAPPVLSRAVSTPPRPKSTPPKPAHDLKEP